MGKNFLFYLVFFCLNKLNQKKQHKNYQDEDKKSAINKKLKNKINK